MYYDSNGVYHNPVNGHIPNNIAVGFATTLGSLTNKVSTVNAVAKAVLNGGTTSGTAKVSAKLDKQTVQGSVIVGTPSTTPPTVVKSDPKNNAVNVAASKVIKVTFSKNVKAGSKAIQLKNSSGKSIAFTRSISGKVLTVKPKSRLAESKYRLILNTGSIKDATGNQLKAKTITFSVGTSPKVIRSDPKNNARNIVRAKTIKVTFNENIKKGTNYRIELKDNKGKKVTIKKSIKGKVLTSHTAKLKAKTKYKLTLYAGSVTDTAGNPLKAKTISFITRST